MNSNAAAPSGFLWDERCFWHVGPNFSGILPVGKFVQPLADGFVDTPDSKRRIKNLLDATGLINQLAASSAASATEEELRRVHTERYLKAFKAASDGTGGILGPNSPFGTGGYEIAALSTGLAQDALRGVLSGQYRNAYALSRPAGHHCLPDGSRGACLLANVAIAIETALAEKRTSRVAVVDWDAHHGNGTETIFYERSDVLTISVHQEKANGGPGDGIVADRGRGDGEGYNINVPLLPGSGHDTYLHAFRRVVVPALREYKPDVIIVACGFDPSCYDPLARLSASFDTFGEMTRMMMDAAAELCGGKLVFVQEGGYSEEYAPLCGLKVISVLAGAELDMPEPRAAHVQSMQPTGRLLSLQLEMLDEIAAFLKL